MTNLSNKPLDVITVEQLAERLGSSNAPVQFVDVREPEEVSIASLDGFLNLPLSRFGEWSGQIFSQLDPDTETIVLCHHGIRSAQMCQWLQHQGFSQVKNVTGGIDAYSMLVDPSIPRY
ncbi:rhodanese-like domain-containing protein [Leptolyngbya ohadii]|uniref:rhodanese-like domain-containing protein n=1 Tax=Leptolyngbya ohadii TaxID=1962290 RepID=UPI000B5984CE|nr:rhodanese-like domain-containing protein [Leptolyngbya ohadii]